MFLAELYAAETACGKPDQEADGGDACEQIRNTEFTGDEILKRL
jgi:hypothetical protein